MTSPITASHALDNGLPETADIALSVEDVSIVYGDGEKAFHAVGGASLEIRQGEFVALVGPSGCGKTSLLKSIAGLVPLSEGSITLPRSGHGAPFAMVFQSPSLLPWRSVIRNVVYGMPQQWKRRRENREAAREAIKLVGLAGKEDRYPGQLSGGMKHRVNLARALVTDPALVLLDEPFSALDAQLREKMQEELLAVWQKTSTTALIVTHQVDEAIFLADRVVVMSANPGRIKREFVVDLPRPRDLSIKRTREFMDLELAIWNELELMGK